MSELTPDNFYVRRVNSIAEYQSCQHVHRLTWGLNPQDTVVHLPMLISLQKYGGLVLGAFTTTETGEKLVGFAVSYIGQDQETRQFFHFSQITGILPDWQGQGVGFALKTRQREEVLAQGFNLIRWSFDPLETRNAYFNLSRLGGISRQYIPEMYGQGWGGLYGQLATDRLVVDWELDSRRVIQKLEEVRQGANLPDLLDGTYPVLAVKWHEQGFPLAREIDLNQNAPSLKLEVPYSFKKIPGLAPPEEAQRWRSQTRAVFLHYLEKGYRVTGLATNRDENRMRAFYLFDNTIQ